MLNEDVIDDTSCEPRIIVSHLQEENDIFLFYFFGKNWEFVSQINLIEKHVCGDMIFLSLKRWQ